jgi:hypothetical protein
MSTHKARYLSPILLLVSLAPAKANLIDVTNASQVTLGAGDSLIFYISSDLPSCGNQSQYPSEIEMILGSMPLGGPTASIPGTSGVYMPGILFTGTIESQNGSISIPLADPDAARLGLPAGDLLLAPGSQSGGPHSGPIDLLSAEVTLSSQEAAALFASGEVVIDLHNIGAPIPFGFSSAPIATDFTASLVSSDGSQSVGARVMQVDCIHNNAPEPGTIGLLLIGLAIIARRQVARTPSSARDPLVAPGVRTFTQPFGSLVAQARRLPR